MSLIRQHIQKMAAYKPPLEGRNPKDFLLLDFNERMIPLGSKIKKALIGYIEEDNLQYYPSYGDITRKIANYAKVKTEQVMITNGSDQGIDVIMRAVCTEGEEIILPNPSFAMYWQIAHIENLAITAVPYTDDYQFPTQQIIERLNPKTRIIVIPNSNNPTGTAVPLADILKIAAIAPNTALLIDECYFEYTKITAKDHVEQYPNIFITRTFSKTWGLASFRLGYVIASIENIDNLLKVRGPYDMNKSAVVAVNAALDDPSYMQSYVNEVLNISKPLLENFLIRKGCPFWPSSANFIYTFPQDADVINDQLRQAGILVRPKKDINGKLGLRITIGNKMQTERLITELDRILR
jgi:histidinol-phosphate aminotransferase